MPNAERKAENQPARLHKLALELHSPVICQYGPISQNSGQVLEPDSVDALTYPELRYPHMTDD